MLVLDASALVDLLLARPQAEQIGRHVADHTPEIHAPELIDLEVLSALRRLVSSGETSSERAAEAVDDLLALPIERHRHAPLLERVWELRATVTTYDASYVALAEALSDPAAALLTTDVRLARATAANSQVKTLLIA
jgi:predicted nucleic acid-binding protein